MTGDFLVDWALLAVSFFDTILLLWLGAMVLLNAERRTRGVWLAGGGLLLAGGFFISHSAILGHGLRTMSWGMNFWWRAGWVPAVLSPALWYVVILWYAGFWEDPEGSLHCRQRRWASLVAVLGAGLAALLTFANPLPSYAQVLRLELSATPSVAGIPLLVLVYPVYIVLCIGLSLDALRRPGPSRRVMGDLARRRARPWLVAASAVLLLVSFLVGGAMLWIVLTANQRALSGVYDAMLRPLARLDVLIASLIGVAVLLAGQAVVVYEVFTGKTLPRRGLRRHWHQVILLAAGYSALVAASLARQWSPIYGLLLAAIVLGLSYAVFSWYAYAERERTTTRLRPFLASQGLFDHLLGRSPAGPGDVDVTTLFRALCDDVLGARVAYLTALGPLSPLAGPPLAYPDSGPVQLQGLAEIAGRLTSPQTLCVPVDPAAHAGAGWAVPLWSERGLIGILLLGDRLDGAPYAQEEIEIARAVGERLVDLHAGAGMARRLVALQRQRLAESGVLDRRARRVLHDDVLPRLHAAMLTLSTPASNGDGTSSEGIALLAGAHRQISDLLRDMPPTAAPEIARLGLAAALRHMLDGELSGAFDGVTWEVDPEADARATSLPPLIAEVVFYAAREAIRNAARYGRHDDPARLLHLVIAIGGRHRLEVVVEDDGGGLGIEDLGIGANGHGLALHSTLMAVVGGSLSVESVPGKGTRVVLGLPSPEVEPVFPEG